MVWTLDSVFIIHRFFPHVGGLGFVDVVDFFPSPSVGFVEEFDLGKEHVSVVRPVAGHHSALRFLMRFKVAVCVDVEDFGEGLGVSANENRPMAIQRLPF